MVHYVLHFQTTGSHYFKHENNLNVLHSCHAVIVNTSQNPQYRTHVIVYDKSPFKLSQF